MADETTPTVPAITPGYKTSEFWLSTLATVIGLAYAAGIIHVDGSTGLDKAIAFAASTLAAIGYSVSRSIVKKG